MFAPKQLNLSTHQAKVNMDRTNLLNSSAAAGVNESTYEMFSPTTARQLNPTCPDYNNQQGDLPSPPRTQSQSQPPSQMNTVFGSRTFRDDFDLKPLSSTNSSNLPMLMLMDSAQSSAIDSLHRQLAEERERATRRIQTETLMATILDERTSTSKKLDEVSTNFSAQFQSAQEEHRKLTETQQSAVENAQRRFNMERRLNETLKKAKEECESKQLSTEKTLGGEIQRITILLEAEKAAHGSDLKYSKEELARERELHDKIKLEREAQTSSLLTELKRAFEAEQKTMDEKLSAAEAGYASNVKLFEQQVSAIVTQTEVSM